MAILRVFFGMVKWSFQLLRPGDHKVSLNHLAWDFFGILCCWIFSVKNAIKNCSQGLSPSTPGNMKDWKINTCSRDLTWSPIVWGHNFIIYFGSRFHHPKKGHLSQNCQVAMFFFLGKFHRDLSPRKLPHTGSLVRKSTPKKCPNDSGFRTYSENFLKIPFSSHDDWKTIAFPLISWSPSWVGHRSPTFDWKENPWKPTIPNKGHVLTAEFCRVEIFHLETPDTVDGNQKSGKKLTSWGW